jgi:hypothetical protein
MSLRDPSARESKESFHALIAENHPAEQNWRAVRKSQELRKVAFQQRPCGRRIA